MLPPATGAAGVERQFLPDRKMDDVDDPDLGAAAMEEDIAGEGGEAGGSGLGAAFEDWPDDAEAEVVPRRQPAPDHQGAGPSAAPAAHGGAQKRQAASTHFGSRPKKPKSTVVATKRDEAAAKAARFRKVVKQPQAVSA